MKHYDVIILGAGASGCMCALSCNKSKSILVVDKLSKAGKKLMATGNGRCNITNTQFHPSEKYYNQNIDKFLKRFNYIHTLNFFSNLGLITLPQENGLIYPLTNSAKSVIEVINNAIDKNNNINLSLENEIEKVEKIDKIYKVYTKNQVFSCEKLVVATGGKSAEGIFNNFNLEYKPFIPSLVALRTQSTRSLDGIRVSNVNIQASCNGKTYSENGEILFKESGVSGIVAFNISTLFARENNFNGKIKIDLLPEIPYSGLINMLESRKSINVKVKNFFDGLFLSQIGYFILNQSKIQNEEKSCLDLTSSEIEKFAYNIKNIELKVNGHYDNNQVHSGGICLEELTDNLESKKHKNLFFCGEVCDIDGICGGYNLQWAWTSGHIVGENL